MGQLHTSLWQLIIGRDISAMEVPLKGARDPSPSLDSSAWCTGGGKRSPKTSGYEKLGISNCPGEIEGCEKPSCPFKGHVHILTCSQALLMSTGRHSVTQEESETYRERLSFVASQ